MADHTLARRGSTASLASSGRGQAVKVEVDEEGGLGRVFVEGAPPSGSEANTAEVLLKTLLDDFECNVCMETLVCPLTTRCGHTACGPCLSRWERRDDEDGQPPRTQCPICRNADAFPAVQVTLVSTLLDNWLERALGAADYQQWKTRKQAWEAEQAQRDRQRPVRPIAPLPARAGLVVDDLDPRRQRAPGAPPPSERLPLPAWIAGPVHAPALPVHAGWRNYVAVDNVRQARVELDEMRANLERLRRQHGDLGGADVRRRDLARPAWLPDPEDDFVFGNDGADDWSSDDDELEHALEDVRARRREQERHEAIQLPRDRQPGVPRLANPFPRDLARPQPPPAPARVRPALFAGGGPRRVQFDLERDAGAGLNVRPRLIAELEDERARLERDNNELEGRFRELRQAQAAVERHEDAPAGYAAFLHARAGLPRADRLPVAARMAPDAAPAGLLHRRAEARQVRFADEPVAAPQPALPAGSRDAQAFADRLRTALDSRFLPGGPAAAEAGGPGPARVGGVGNPWERVPAAARALLRQVETQVTLVKDRRRLARANGQEMRHLYDAIGDRLEDEYNALLRAATAFIDTASVVSAATKVQTLLWFEQDAVRRQPLIARLVDV